MKKIILFIVALFLVTVAMQSQVKIGSNTTPEKGAILDLNADAGYKGGLLLPNVDITNVEQIPAGFTELSVQNQENNDALTGMVVWNTHLGSEGIYMWDGKKWNPINLKPQCTAPTITYLTGHPVIVPADFLTSPAGTLTAVLTSPGATGFELSPTITPLYDSPAGGLTASLYGSTNNSTGTQFINFTGSQYGAYEIQTRAIGNCLNPTYKKDTVYVGCGALVADNTWKAFMCHNLGADYTADPFIPSYKINGAYYRWGVKDPVASAPLADGTAEIPIPWVSTPPTGYYGDGTDNTNVTNKSNDDPCPDGWRVPSPDELYNTTRLNPHKGWLGINGGAGLTTWFGGRYGRALVYLLAGVVNNPSEYGVGRGLEGLFQSNKLNASLYVRGGGSSITGTGWYVGESIRCIEQ